MFRTLRIQTAAALLAPLFVGLVMAGCGPIFERTYRIDVRQGNYVSQKMVAQLSVGMTEDQVRFIMGSPLLIDPFQKGRWDYVYLFTPGHGPKTERRITLFFEQGKLARLDGDVVGSTSPLSADEPGTPRVIEIAPVAK